MQRVLVVGTSGSGKTTVAEGLARTIGVPHIELDELYWEPNWEPADHDVFRDRVEAATASEAWVVCGNYYSSMIDVTWPRADTVVWLDLPRHTVIRRIVLRTAGRVLSREPLWNGNVETLRGSMARESIVRWAWSSFPRNRERYSEMITDPKWQHLQWIRLRTPAEVRRFLRNPRP
jgi:adenylate kinase family enzyme